MDFHGLPWTLMDTKLPMGMEFHGHPWTSVNFHRHPWASMDIGGYKAAHGQGIPWTPMDIDQMAAPMDTNFPQPRSVKVHGFS